VRVAKDLPAQAGTQYVGVNGEGTSGEVIRLQVRFDLSPARPNPFVPDRLFTCGKLRGFPCVVLRASDLSDSERTCSADKAESATLAWDQRW